MEQQVKALMRMRMRITMKMMSPLSAKQLASERLLYPDELRGLQIGIHPIHKCIVCEGCQCCNHRELRTCHKLQHGAHCTPRQWAYRSLRSGETLFTVSLYPCSPINIPSLPTRWL